MLNPTIPFGGFLVCQSKREQCRLIDQLNADSSCRSIYLTEIGLTMAVWSQFKGQGFWHSESGTIVFDLDLTNLTELALLVELSQDGVDQGALLFALYRKYGPDFCDKLRGAFAFALWDNQSSELLVVTDCFGIRPVVYSRQKDLFAAASRIRQLEKVGIDKTINPEAIYHYLFFQAICSPISIYLGVQKLEPGKSILVKEGSFSERSWYDLSYRPVQGRNEVEWCQNVRSEMERAVKNFVPELNDTHTGCFLSGGTDSSSIAGYYSQFSKNKAKTFSIGFDDPKYNELDFARVAVNHFGTDQHEYLVTPQDVLALIYSLPQIYDEPLGNASVIAAYYCAKLAGENGVETMLGGDGGDEIFGGNERYVTNLMFQRYSNLPKLVRKGLFEPSLKMMPSSGLFYKAKRYIRRANIPNPKRFYSYNLLAENDNAEIFQTEFLEAVDIECFFNRTQELYDRAAPAGDTDRLMYIDMKNTITDNDLRKVTQMVEAAGIRVRYPLLDRDLVDFTCTIPPALKVKTGKNRYIFKQAMRGFLPDEIIHKSKHGMGLPIAKWLREDNQLNALLEDTLFSSNAEIKKFIKPDYLLQLKTYLNSENTSYYGDNLWVFLVLEMWLKAHKIG